MEHEICLNCGSKKVIRNKVDFKVYGISLGKFPAEVCSACGEEVFDEATSDKINKIAKEKGIISIVITINIRINHFLDKILYQILILDKLLYKYF